MANEAFDAAVGKRQKEVKKKVLETLQEAPIVEYACRKAGIGRTTYYRWYHASRAFARDADEAIKLGDEHMNDLSESQLIQLIKEKKFPAISMWLKYHSPRYQNQRMPSQHISIFELVKKMKDDQEREEKERMEE